MGLRIGRYSDAQYGQAGRCNVECRPLQIGAVLGIVALERGSAECSGLAFHSMDLHVIAGAQVGQAKQLYVLTRLVIELGRRARCDADPEHTHRVAGRHYGIDKSAHQTQALRPHFDLLRKQGSRRVDRSLYIDLDVQSQGDSMEHKLSVGVRGDALPLQCEIVVEAKLVIIP